MVFERTDGYKWNVIVVTKYWASIFVERRQKLVNSMPRKCRAVIKNHGSNTKYYYYKHFKVINVNMHKYMRVSLSDAIIIPSYYIKYLIIIIATNRVLDYLTCSYYIPYKLLI